MTEGFSKLSFWLKDNLMVVLLSLVLFLSLVIPATFTAEEGEAEPILKISDIEGPMIDSAAAMIVVETCSTLPFALWLFLLIAYALLLVFNLSFTFGKTRGFQWRWEAVYTVLFLLGWLFWDGCRSYPWFPLSILQSGFLIYSVYLYLFERKAKV